MAELVNPATATRPRHGGLALLLAAAFAAIIGGAWMQAARAGELFDPTQPPGAAAAAGEDAAHSGPVLQSLMLGPGRKSAMISGQVVKTGDRVGDAEVAGIDARGVRLKHDDGTVETLELYPGVVKKAIAEPAAGKSARKNR